MTASSVMRPVGLQKKVVNLLDVMRMECCTEKLSLYQDRIHVANGTYYLNGTFSPQKISAGTVCPFLTIQKLRSQ